MKNKLYIYYMVIALFFISFFGIFFYFKKDVILNKKSDNVLTYYNNSISQDIIFSDEKDSIIFADTFSNDWKVYSWGCEFYISSFAYKSSGSLAISFKERWSGVDFRVSDFSTKDFNSLKMVINPGSLNMEDLYVYLYTKEKSALSSIQILNYMPEIYSKNEWYEVYIPLSDLKAEESNISGFIIESASIGSLQIDEIVFYNIESDLVKEDDKNTINSNIPNEKNVLESNQTFVETEIPKSPILNDKEPIFSENIYLDSLLSGWYIQKPLEVNLFDKTYYDGQSSMGINFSNSWDELVLVNNNGISIDYFDGLWMHIKRKGGNENIQIILYNKKDEIIGKGRIGDFVENRKLKDDLYMSSYIPFRNILYKRDVVAKILITSEKPLFLNIDNFKFTAEPIFKPFGSYHYVVSSKVFHDDIYNGWHFDSWGVDSSIFNDKGLNVIKFSLIEPGGGLLLKNLIGLDSRVFKSIVFGIKFDSIDDDNLSLTLYDLEGVSLGSVWLSDYIDYDKDKTYQSVKIKFTSFEKESGNNNDNRFQEAKIGGIQFSSGKITNYFYISNLGFDF